MSDNANEREIRLGKLARLREIGYDPYAVESFPFTETAENLKDTTAQREGEVVPFAGRIVSRREMGKSQFLHLSDGADRFQIYVRKNDIDEAAWEALNLLDLGDHLGVVGSLFITKTGEPSLQVSELKPLSKSLHVVPIPKQRGEEQWYGLTDTNVRFRHRHLDLITNPDARRTLVDRSRLGLPRSRDSDAAARGGRGGGAHLFGALQRLRPGSGPAHLAGALPQADPVR
jgi:lysyl-tRNA synthetase class 2